MTSVPTCKAENCGRPIERGGYCHKHYMRLWRNGKVEPSPETMFRQASLSDKLRMGRKVMPNGCWEWQRALNVTGYGTFRHHGKRHMAYRAAYERAYGPIPEGAYVCHSCDNRKCVNPEHLFISDHMGNMRDMRSKGRHQRGERHFRAKLTADDVRQIRRRSAQGEGNPKLASEFGVSKSTISSIVHRRYWRHIE